MPLRLFKLCALAFAAWVLQSPSDAAQLQVFGEAPVELALTVYSTNPEIITGPDADGITIREAHIIHRILNNADVLAAMQAAKLIPSAKNFTLVAIWANWPDADPFIGNAYRFYVREIRRNTANTLHRVPSRILSLSPLDWIRAATQISNPRDRATNPERYESYTQLAFDFSEISGTLLGEDTGGGLYKTSVYARSTPNQFLPTASTLKLSGNGGDGFSSATVNIGSARFIPRSDFIPGSLPARTTEGGSYGGSICFQSSTFKFAGLANYTPIIHYFLPLTAEMLLDYEVSLPTIGAKAAKTEIRTTRLTQADLIRGILADNDINDPTGWTLYLHVDSKAYTPYQSFDLALGHSDGRIIRIQTRTLAPASYISARAYRYQYRDTLRLSGQQTLLSDVTHEGYWSLENKATIHFEANGQAEATSTYGPIPELENERKSQPAAGHIQLFGTYARFGAAGQQSGLAQINLAYAAPVAQYEIPAGWHSIFPSFADDLGNYHDSQRIPWSLLYGF